MDGIFTPNESSTAGMLLALQDIGKAGAITFVGFDYSSSFIEPLREGRAEGLHRPEPGEHGLPEREDDGRSSARPDGSEDRGHGRGHGDAGEPERPGDPGGHQPGGRPGQQSASAGLRSPVCGLRVDRHRSCQQCWSLQPSLDSSVMLCPHFGTCGGCQTQDVPYAEQLLMKQRELQRLLRGSLGGAPPCAADASDSPGRRRDAVAFPTQGGVRLRPPPRRGSGFVMGHFAAGANTVVPIETCPVHSTRANVLAFALRDRLARAGLGAAGSGPRDVLRHVIVRTTRDDREAIVMLVVTRNDKALRAPLRAFLASPDPPDGLFVNVHDRPGPYMVGDDTIRIHGRPQVRETIRTVAFLVSPTAFFQTNPEAAALLVDEVVAMAGAPRRCPRLVPGQRAFCPAAGLARLAVLAVEENRPAVEDGRTNQRLNRIAANRVRFIAGRAEDAVRRFARERPDLVVLDPPRSGCPAVVLDAVFEELRPPRAIYVSCNPETLARELPHIVTAGYRIARVQPVDMFPHTPHIETVVTLDG